MCAYIAPSLADVQRLEQAKVVEGPRRRQAGPRQAGPRQAGTQPSGPESGAPEPGPDGSDNGPAEASDGSSDGDDEAADLSKPANFTRKPPGRDRPAAGRRGPETGQSGESARFKDPFTRSTRESARSEAASDGGSAGGTRRSPTTFRFRVESGLRRRGSRERSRNTDASAGDGEAPSRRTDASAGTGGDSGGKSAPPPATSKISQAKPEDRRPTG